MNSFASTNIKCEVSENNKEILKRALCREMGKVISISEWKENDFDCEIGDSYIIKLSIDELPDSIGYSIKAWVEHTPKEKKRRRDFFLASFILCFIIFLFWLIFKYHFGWFILAALLLLVLSTSNPEERNIKNSIKKDFKKAFKDFDRI